MWSSALGHSLFTPCPLLPFRSFAGPLLSLLATLALSGVQPRCVPGCSLLLFSLERSFYFPCSDSVSDSLFCPVFVLVLVLLFFIRCVCYSFFPFFCYVGLFPSSSFLSSRFLGYFALRYSGALFFFRNASSGGLPPPLILRVTLDRLTIGEVSFLLSVKLYVSCVLCIVAKCARARSVAHSLRSECGCTEGISSRTVPHGSVK